MYVLGLNPGFGGFNYHDPAAVLVRDGRVIAAVEEERFTHIKSAPGIFPSRSVQFCLENAKIRLEDLDEVAIGYSPSRWSERLGLEAFRATHKAQFLAATDRARNGMAVPKEFSLTEIADAGLGLADIIFRERTWRDEKAASRRIIRRLGVTGAPVCFVEHHLAHAASAYYPSRFDRATALVLDGVGEVSSSSVWLVENGRFRLVREILLPNSLGYLYAAMTEFLGFHAWEGEGKLMALAAYGCREVGVSKRFDSVGLLTSDGYDVSDFVSSNLGSGLSLNLETATRSLAKVFEIPPRRSGDVITSVHKSIAKRTQDFLEEAVLKLVRDAISKTAISDLVLAGGVFLNCKLNMTVRERSAATRVFVQPVAGDSGLALGAALLRAMRDKQTDADALCSMALGPEVSDDEIVATLTAWQVPFSRPNDPSELAAKLLSEGRILLWYQGRAEFGPRALGHRSILADPRRPDVRIIVNRRVKNREDWRPFGPAILEEFAPDILENFQKGDTARYMIQSYLVRPEWIGRIPGVVHPADHSTRPQTVNAEAEPQFHKLLMRFYEMTGVPVLLNTSLNDRGDPIANSPRDAIRLFYTSGADVLMLGKCVIRKEQSQEVFEQ